MLEAYVEYYEAAKTAMHAGATCHDVHVAVSRGFIDRGYHLGHVTGHSIGMTMIEFPKVGEGSDVELRENMVLSMHPHAIAANGEDCLYMQDTWLVTPAGGVRSPTSRWRSGCPPERRSAPAGIGAGRDPAGGTLVAVSWPWIVLLAIDIGVVVAAEWPRFERLAGADARRTRDREKRKAKLGSSRPTTTSSCAAFRPTSRRCRRSRSARRPGEARRRVAERAESVRGVSSVVRSRRWPPARGYWAGWGRRFPCSATPGSRTPGTAAGACRASAFGRDRTTPARHVATCGAPSMRAANIAGSTPEPASATRMLSAPPRWARTCSSLAEGGVMSLIQKRNMNRPAPPWWHCRRRRHSCLPAGAQRRLRARPGRTGRGTD